MNKASPIYITIEEISTGLVYYIEDTTNSSTTVLDLKKEIEFQGNTTSNTTSITTFNTFNSTFTITIQ